MEIGRVNRQPIQREEERKITTGKKGFSQSFSHAKERKSEEQLKKMAKDINSRGNRLALTKTYADVRMYKKMIKEYLESVLQFMYQSKKDISFWQTQYFITVDTVDEKLEEITNKIMEKEAENIDIASTIDEIQGLIVDIYR
ncbi:MAG: YaaR family protein [Clostridiales bacterium]|nr:YaaR family protein [Clostridiales bacterium]